MSYVGKTLSQPKEAPLTEVRIKVESTSPVSEVKIKLEPGSGEYRRKGNLERYRETRDLSYLEQTMKEILVEAPGLLKRWFEETLKYPFPLRTDLNHNEYM